MSKFTIIDTPDREKQDHISTPEEFRKLPKTPNKTAIDTIVAFSRSYSLRKGRYLDKMEFNLN